MTDNLGNNRAGAFCLSSLAFAFMSCLSLGDEISPWKVEMIFNSRNKFTGFFMNLFLASPSPTSSSLLPSCLPPFQLGCVSPGCQMQNDEAGAVPQIELVID